VLLGAVSARPYIGQHLGIVWQSEAHSYLLTWAGQDTKPLDAEFMEKYRYGTGKGCPGTGTPSSQSFAVFMATIETALCPSGVDPSLPQYKGIQ
jgi:hypothetical protein